MSFKTKKRAMTIIGNVISENENFKDLVYFVQRYEYIDVDEKNGCECVKWSERWMLNVIKKSQCGRKICFTEVW